MVIRPCSMPKASLSTLATGARQLVVQEALEMMWCLFAVVVVVVHAHDDGEVLVLGRGGDDHLLRARLAVRLRLCLVAEEPGGLDDDVNAQLLPGQLAGSRSDRTRIFLPSTTMASSRA